MVEKVFKLKKKRLMNFERVVIRFRISIILVLYLLNMDCLKFCFGYILLRWLKMRGIELLFILFLGYFNFL